LKGQRKFIKFLWSWEWNVLSKCFIQESHYLMGIELCSRGWNTPRFGHLPVIPRNISILLADVNGEPRGFLAILLAWNSFATTSTCSWVSLICFSTGSLLSAGFR
jgi:hypothetical protein